MEGYVNIHGKQYETVAHRVWRFRQEHSKYGVETELLTDPGAANIVVMRAVITDDNGRILATGHAEEVYGSTNINKTSALENCETSAIGRALAALGFISESDSFASADEVQNAIAAQEKMEEDKAAKIQRVIDDNAETISYVAQALEEDNYSMALEGLEELSHDEKAALWIAPTKAKAMGIEPPFTTEQMKKMRSNEFYEARRQLVLQRTGKDISEQ